MADFFAIARDLLALEINTILKDGMSSQKMPAPEDAVIDVLIDYCDYLRPRVEASRDGKTWKDVTHDQARAFVTEDRRTLDAAGLQTLRAIALALKLLPGTPEGDQAVLSRIQRYCDQMKGFIKQPVCRGKALALTTEQVVLLRKIWEIGTETVVMQTVVQIDGDVVTRIQQGRQGTENQQLHAAHRQSVEVSFRHWQFLVDALGRMVGAAMRDLLK